MAYFPIDFKTSKEFDVARDGVFTLYEPGSTYVSLFMGPDL